MQLCLLMIKEYMHQEIAERLIHTFVSWKIDFMNSLLYGTSKIQLGKLQRVQNVTVGLLTRTTNESAYNISTNETSLASCKATYYKTMSLKIERVLRHCTLIIRFNFFLIKP